MKVKTQQQTNTGSKLTAYEKLQKMLTSAEDAYVKLRKDGHRLPPLRTNEEIVEIMGQPPVDANSDNYKTLFMNNFRFMDENKSEIIIAEEFASHMNLVAAQMSEDMWYVALMEGLLAYELRQPLPTCVFALLITNHGLKLTKQMNVVKNQLAVVVGV